MKLADVVGIIIGLLVLLSIPAMPLLSAVNKGEVIVDRRVIIPPIDTSRTADTETATFATG